ncbi:MULTISPECIES: DNA topoisomerase IB [Trichocoleus]|uniref:DNA topoisomerase n=1 Tax=Trichocoleus desertorum GB2-A4 TaxID=2933944 RepID=A0ABV0JAS5_9CYAN|nr:DNA topoisomerase IB [Trichocoleus sp. FACHB-46]MBD1863111.1 DNA topoisomerase IB [Trichocoleus sp. FACHB-46]
MQLQRQRSKRSQRRKFLASLITDPVQSAQVAGLRYVNDDSPGIQRQPRGKGFVYLNIDGKIIRDRQEIQRIESLAVPPAYKDVWICPFANGHIQATGRDAKGRKQYRYHSLWRQVRDQTKFTRLIAFSDALPTLRERVDHDLGLRGLSREKVLATVVRLLETTCIRVGNETYARTNRSFGLTTMRCQHVDISGTTLRFKFRGKSGVDHDIQISDRRLARIIKRCQEIPGYELFQYLDDAGQSQCIDSGAVNTYLQEITKQDFTAKDFRTWSGTVMAALELDAMGPFQSQTQAKKNINQAIKNVAAHLGNRPATCRKYYVHPAILDAYLDGSLMSTLEKAMQQPASDSAYALNPEEMAVVAILEQQLEARQPVAS